jgi:glucose/mannose-6-phosphate isomerase
MHILNDPLRLRSLDTLGSLKTTEEYHLQFAEGLTLSNGLIGDLPREKGWHEILILGTGGGSSIAGALLTSLFFDKLKLPVIINQGYNLPAFVDENTLVVALSHSGNTEEIMSSLGLAARQGCRPVAITSGGALATVCRAEGFPHLIVPRDIGHPRRNPGYIVVPLIKVLADMGLIPRPDQDITETIEMLKVWAERYGVDSPVERNLAKQLALQLKGLIPLIYGSTDHLQAVAWRWKNQFGENSKLMSFYNLIPHVHHDEAVGWDMEPELLQKFGLLMLRDEILDDPTIQKRKDITTEMLSERMGAAVEVWAEGTSRLARLFSLIHLGDFVSLYAAAIRGIDPTPVKIIDLFKEKMSR